MAIKADREYRIVQTPDIQFRVMEGEDKEYRVEGYATTYDDPYVLWNFDGVDYKEEISRDALAGADMTDVIFLYNHLESNERGLHVIADLSSTEDSRRMYESIKAGLVTQMSWAFTIEESSYNEKTHTRSILKVNKVYDVSAVSIPANPNTDISARSYWDGVIEEERRRERERAKKILKLKLMLKEKNNGN